jgi:disulfide bond formation protein DsbB
VPSDLSRLLNALGLIAVDTVLALAFIDQLWFRDLPCPLCNLQRAGFTAAGFGLALNLLFGPRPSHYGVTILGASVGAAISMRQTLLHIVPGTGSYGNAIFGLHLYTWAFIALP